MNISQRKLEHLAEMDTRRFEDFLNGKQDYYSIFFADPAKSYLENLYVELKTYAKSENKEQQAVLNFLGGFYE